MNAEQIELVQDSFEQVKPIADKAAEIFYARLFEVAPHTRHMFKGDMTKQGAMLMSTLGLAVVSLNDLDRIIPAVRALGKRHIGYNVRSEHFAIVGDAFLWTLEQAFGPTFTPELKLAWTEAYLLLAGVMQEAMREEAIPAQEKTRQEISLPVCSHSPDSRSTNSQRCYLSEEVLRVAKYRSAQ